MYDSMPTTPQVREKRVAALQRRGDYKYLVLFGGLATTLAVLLVGFSIIMLGDTPQSTTVTFQILHAICAIVITIVGSWLLIALTRKVLSSPDENVRRPSWNAGVSTVLLVITAVADVISNILLIIARSSSVPWLSVAEDVFTIPETLVAAGILVSLELNPHMSVQYRRAKIAVLPLITGLSIAMLLLNIVGVNTWNDTVEDLGIVRALCRTLATMFRGGALLMSLDHSMRAARDLLFNPHRHSKAHESFRPPKPGSGEFREVTAPLIDPHTPYEASPNVKTGTQFGEEVRMTPQLHAAITALEDIQDDAEERSTLFGRRPFASIASYSCGGIVIMLFAVSHAVENAGTALDTVSDITLAVLASFTVIVLLWFVYLGWKDEMNPREMSWKTWASQLPQASTMLRVLAPALLSVAWLVMVAFSNPDDFDAIGVSISAVASLLQGAICTYCLANFPLVMVVRAGVEVSSVTALKGPDNRSLVRAHTLVQLSAAVLVTFNGSMLLLSIWPDALSCSDVNSQADIATRSLAAFYHAFCVGIACNATSLFEFLSQDELNARTVLTRQVRTLMRATRSVTPAATPGASRPISTFKSVGSMASQSGIDPRNGMVELAVAPLLPYAAMMRESSQGLVPASALHGVHGSAQLDSQSDIDRSSTNEFIDPNIRMSARIPVMSNSSDFMMSSDWSASQIHGPRPTASALLSSANTIHEEHLTDVLLHPDDA